MAYKDKEKQREASRERQRRYKAKQKALPNLGVTEGVTSLPATLNKIIEDGGSIGLASEILTEVVDGKYNPEYLPGGKYYNGCCYQDEHGNWTVRGGQPVTCKVKADCPEVQAIWDRRTRQGQPDVYGAISAKTQSINPMMVGYVPDAQA